MVKVSKFKGLLFLGLALVAVGCVLAPFAFAQEGEHGAAGAAGAAGASSTGDGLKALGLAIGAGIAIAGAGLGTGRAQAGVGAGGSGALAEKPELFTNILILFAIPETIVILGFVIAFMLYGKI
jgi:V/A-type H+-transporting ATPase subunit K